MKLILQKIDGTKFDIPNDNVYESDEMFKRIQKLKIGECYLCEVKQPRNLKYHRGFMALLAYVQENNHIPDVSNMVDFAKYMTGFYKVIEIDGKQFIKFRSISFESVDQFKFNEFVNRFIEQCILRNYLPSGFDFEEWMQGFKE